MDGMHCVQYASPLRLDMIVTSHHVCRQARLSRRTSARAA